MEFYGIDLGWTGKPSGLARMEWDGKRLELRECTRLATHAEVLQVIPECGAAWIGLDAPVRIGNASGMREADREAHQLFSKQHAGCYPVNRGMPFAGKVLEFVAKLEKLGFSTEPAGERQIETRQLFEVYPHAASIRLFGLEQILPYKKGRIEERREALLEFRRLLAGGLASRRPSFCSEVLIMPGQGARELKACEDQLDAVLCAYIAAHYWYWGLARNNILGQVAEGWIVNPSF